MAGAGGLRPARAAGGAGGGLAGNACGRTLGTGLVLLGPAFTLALLHGGFAGLRFVPTSDWGGLLVTLVVGGLGGLLPPGTSVPQFYGVMAGIVLYAAAYLAEVVRGGLQSIAPTQFEASEALGFSYWGTMRIVILPQALSNVLPALVSIFINLFNSSTLVLVVSVFDMLGMVQNAAQNPNGAGYFTEGYVFAGLVFWVICYSVSSYGESLNRRRNKRNRDA